MSWPVFTCYLEDEYVHEGDGRVCVRVGLRKGGYPATNEPQPLCLATAHAHVSRSSSEVNENPLQMIAASVTVVHTGQTFSLSQGDREKRKEQPLPGN